MVIIENLKPGDSVHYMPDHYKTIDHFENGVVKKIAPNGNVFVVYNCNGEWHRYKEYTAASTKPEDLYMGWKQ